VLERKGGREACSHPAARSASRQRSEHSSPIRSPAKVNVASIARRSTCRARAGWRRSSAQRIGRSLTP